MAPLIHGSFNIFQAIIWRTGIALSKKLNKNGTVYSRMEGL